MKNLPGNKKKITIKQFAGTADLKNNIPMGLNVLIVKKQSGEQQVIEQIWH
jgi:hypothetical protein